MVLLGDDGEICHLRSEDEALLEQALVLPAVPAALEPGLQELVPISWRGKQESTTTSNAEKAPICFGEEVE